MTQKKIVIEQITLIEFKVPFKKAFLTSRNANVAGHGILVIVEGFGPKGHIVGVGECSPRKLVTGETVEGVWPLAQQYRELLLRKNSELLLHDDAPSMIEKIMATVTQEVEENNPARRFPSVSLGYEMALLDITAQGLKIPVYQLLGGKVHKPEANAFTFSARYDSSEEEIVGMARRAGRYTYARFKGSGKAERDLRLLERFMGRFEDNALNTHLWIDLNENCDMEIFAFVGELFKRLDACNQERIVVLEQPLPRGEREALSALARHCRSLSAKRKSTIRIMADEAFDTEKDLREMPELMEVDALNIKPQKAGSLIACRRIADYVHTSKKEMGVYIGGVIGTTDITSWATYHLSRAIPNLQYSTLGPKSNFKFVLASVPLRRLTNGRLCPPIFPGLGTGLNPYSLSRAAARIYPEGVLSGNSPLFAIRGPRRRQRYGKISFQLAVDVFRRFRTTAGKVYHNPRVLLQVPKRLRKLVGRTVRLKGGLRGQTPEKVEIPGGASSRVSVWRPQTAEFILRLGEANRFHEPWVQRLDKKHLDSYLIEREALARGFSVVRYSNLLFEATDPVTGQSMEFYWTAGSAPSMGARHLFSKKQLIKTRIKAAGAPVPEGKEFGLRDKEKAQSYVRSLAGQPFVVKPSVGTGGVGVSTGLLTLEEFEWAWEKIMLSKKASGRNDGFIIVEEQIPGDDYRVFVIGDTAVSIVKRAPAHVVGDGQNSIEYLVEVRNQTRSTNPHLASRRIVLDRSAVFQLTRQGLNKEDIPKRGQVVFLSTAGNISQGGDSINVLEETHPSVLQAAVKAVRAFPGLVVGGVDFLMEDHRVDLAGQRAGICEINSVPASTMHHYPAYGEACNVSRLIFEAYARLRGIVLKEPNNERQEISIGMTTSADNEHVRKWIEPLALEFGVEPVHWRKEKDNICFKVRGSFEPITAMASFCITGTDRVAVESVSMHTDD
jgi:L-alanine-DL-glutamate epimerase-like enolase superfamily enzyme/D-alanine-D-alanine ligase-like ATP-grasp enzyme